jgi:hypothetical protein
MATTKTSKKTAKSKTKDPKTGPEPREGAIGAQNAPGATVGAPDGTSATTPATSDGKKPRAKKERAPKEDLVVFAFRLTPAERDQIHKAAGPAKASKYVRALTRAASVGDLALVTKIVEAVKQELAS